MAWDPIQNGESGASVRAKLNELGVSPVAETVIGDFNTTTAQTPAGSGSANKIRINYGTGGNTTGNEFTVAGDGTITTNTAGRQYIFDVVLRISRSGAAGNSIPMARFCYSADGTETDTVQVGNSFSVRIDDDDTVWREEFKSSFIPADGSKLWVEFARDEAGNNSGDLSADQPTATLLTDTPPWNPVSVASLTISTLDIAVP